LGKKLCPKIIIEGTRLTFKTDIAFALNDHPRIVGPKKYKYHNPLISAEWCSFTNVPWGRGLINFNLEEEEKALETYRTWLKMFQLQKYYSWIIDRFHISTKLYQRLFNQREYDFSWLEDGLNVLGYHIVFISRSDDSFDAALEERLKVSGNPSQYKNVIQQYIDEQKVFRQLINESILPKKEFDISHNDIDLVCIDIADWLEDTGGLWAK